MLIRPLEEGDVVQPFTCGERPLDAYFRRHAWANHALKRNRSYVAVEGVEIQGYSTVVSSQLAVADASSALGADAGPFPSPVLRLARLAVRSSLQRKGIGKALLRHAFELALEAAEKTGCMGVLVDAKAGKESYYERLGFRRLTVVEGAAGPPSRTTLLFIAMGEVERAARGL